ncbi:hypothetical protein [Salmonella enterica]|uniref:hypothetical protein n=1 Tax=Salmonella enterica TaxID=28901 RepID=UPI003F65C936
MDFFRALFGNTGMQKTGDYYALPRTFKLPDAALPTICNITRDLSPDEPVDAARVKRTRHRLKLAPYGETGNHWHQPLKIKYCPGWMPGFWIRSRTCTSCGKILFSRSVTPINNIYQVPFENAL